jgi:dolichol-phosphate mannosyltransferase
MEDVAVATNSPLTVFPLRVPSAKTKPPELAVIIPTFNERDNVAAILERIEDALPGVPWEVIFVDDDSSDGTGSVLHSVCRNDQRVRALRRIGRRGLASAVVEGVLSTSTPYVAVMDADMQHDERLLPPMLVALREDQADLIIGSRYKERGGLGDLDDRRQKISQIATRLSRVVIRADLTDPMSGFFMCRREVFESAVRNLSLQGYKILLDLIASSDPKPRLLELPYVFRSRLYGKSKLDSLVALEYLTLLADKFFGGHLPVRFLMFAAVGGLGVAVHMTVLSMLYLSGLQAFALSQLEATAVAMTFNFFLNNLLTYRDRRLRGLLPVMRGLLTFYAVCSVGAGANVGVANVLFKDQYAWWLSGIAGVLVGVVWNYAVSSIFTWRATNR